MPQDDGAARTVPGGLFYQDVAGCISQGKG